MTVEQKALVDKARESVKAARLLLDQGFPEFSASRSYYAMFYVAEALLLGEGEAFSKHAGVIAAFGRIFAKTGRVPPEFHKCILEALDLRQAGDYDIGVIVSREQAEEQVRRAERFLEGCSSWMP